MHRVLVQETLRTPGAPPWAVIGGVYQFTGSGEQLRLLERMGQICRQANAPFVAGAAADLVGCPSFGTTPDPSDWQAFSAQPDGHQRWERLRRSTEAAYIGLALPRFLLRLPYGRATEAITACGFEEMVGVPDHEHYCWGNPMFACLVLLGQAFSADRWQLRPGSIQDLEGLSLHVYHDDAGDSITKPCAEAWLTEQAAERLLDLGLMPLLSYKNEDRVRLIRFQSIAAPATPLQGRWTASRRRTS
jgi:type VI secretion system protein ImpC